MHLGSLGCTAMDTNTLNLIVLRRAQEAEDIISLDLVSTDGKILPAFKPGAHIDLYLPNGLIRQYSLCHPATSPTEKYSIAVQREKDSRGGSKAVHDQFIEGFSLRASTPRNFFELAPEASLHILLAGGIGITPLICMAQELAKQKENFELHYFCRSQARVAFMDLLASEGLTSSVHLHIETNSRSDISKILKNPKSETHLYVCGPAGFMDYVLEEAQQNQWESTNIHKEYFAAEVAPQKGDQSFEVQIASTGQTYHIPADKTVFEVLDEAGVDIPVSCEQGICGSCVTKVLSGVPDHRDFFLTDDEKAAGNCFTPCCSRAQSPSLLLGL